LIPNWAKDPKVAHKTVNARVETIDTAPSHRQAFEKRRWLIPSDGFYKCKKVLDGKIQYSIGMKVPICLRWLVGRMERSRERRVVAYLHDHHW
jgi:putative SOS response-associated peptidase YedK